MALIAFAAKSFQTADESSEKKDWSTAFSKVVSSVDVTSQEVTSLLALLSASITDGTALPPYLRVPAPYEIGAKLENVDPGILAIRHIAEPGYAAFVCDCYSRCRDKQKS